MKMLRTTRITAADIKDGEYIGKSLDHVEGSLKISASLGTIRCAGTISVTGSISAGAGTSLTAGGDFTVFHAILAGGTGPSVLRMADFPESDQSSNATTVRQMMKNFGCVE